MAAIVEVLSREFVRQSSPTPYSQFELKFSSLDKINRATHTPMVFFYEKNPFGKTSNLISNQLKESLYLTLTKFYPFGGKMNGDTSVICNDTGALFLVAQVDATLSDTMQHFIPNQIDHYLPLGRSTVSYVTEQLVPLAVQVTFFNCGGFSIGFNYSYKIADSWTFSMFLSSWAATCRLGDQTCLNVFRPEFGLGYNLFDPQLLRELRVTNEEESVKEKKKKMVMKRFQFKNQEIMSLKKLLDSSSNPSPVELVSAFIWKQIIQMKKLAAKGSGKSKTLIVANIEVNLRHQLVTSSSSPIGDSAMGNFMVSRPVLLSTLSEMTTDDYSFLVGEFQQGFKKMDSMRFEAFAVKKAEEVWSCNFSSLCGFALYDDVDFGWEKPLLISPKTIAKPAVLLARAKNGDGIEAWINLSEDDMDIFLSTNFLPIASQMIFPSQFITSSRL